MGWTFIRGATKSRVVGERLEATDYVVSLDMVRWSQYAAGTRIQSQVIAYRVVGDNLWSVRECTVTAVDGKVIKDRERVLLLDLMEPSSTGWGYKGMDEAMGPYETNCPVEFLDLAPMPAGPYAASWREKVRANAEKQTPLFV